MNKEKLKQKSWEGVRISTIKDIAEKLNISTAAVSKALNNKEDVSIELKNRVKKTAEEMGYLPNEVAQKLAKNRNNSIGVFVLGIEEVGAAGYFGFKFLEGIIDTANKKKYEVVMFLGKEEISYKKICEEKRVEGVIFIGLRLDDKYIEDIKNIKVPVVVIDQRIESFNIAYISSDNKLGVKKALNHLIENGHKKIGILKAYKEAEISEKRYKAFKEHLEEKDIFDKKFIFNGDFTKKSGIIAGENIAELKEKPTALFCVSDLMAIGVIEGLKNKGIKVPEEISVIGFDNLNIGEFIVPDLTTIAQNGFKIGEEAVESIINRIENKVFFRNIEVEPELVIRSSCKKIK